MRPVDAQITLELNESERCTDEALVDIEVDRATEQLQFTGKSAHASTPDAGENAVDKAMAELEAIGYSNNAIAFYNAMLGFDLRGQKLGIACSDDRSGDLTVNVGLAYMTPAAGEFLLDIRYPVTADHEKLIATVKAALAPWNGQNATHSPPLNLPDDHPLVATLSNTYNEVMNATAFNRHGGGTYARLAQHRCLVLSSW